MEGVCRNHWGCRKGGMCVYERVCVCLELVDEAYAKQVHVCRQKEKREGIAERAG